MKEITLFALALALSAAAVAHDGVVHFQGSIVVSTTEIEIDSLAGCTQPIDINSEVDSLVKSPLINSVANNNLGDNLTVVTIEFN